MEDDLMALMAGVTCFWGAAPQESDRPYIVLRLISQQRDVTTDGFRPGLVRSRVQADCYGLSPGGSADLADRAIQSVEGRRVGRFQAILIDQVRDISGSDSFNDSLGVAHRRVVDLMIYHTA